VINNNHQYTDLMASYLTTAIFFPASLAVNYSATSRLYIFISKLNLVNCLDTEISSSYFGSLSLSLLSGCVLLNLPICDEMSDKRRKHKKGREDPPRSKSTTPRSSALPPARPRSATPRSSLPASRPDSIKLRQRSQSRTSSKSPSPASSFLSLESYSSSSSKTEKSPSTCSPRSGTRKSAPGDRRPSLVSHRSPHSGNSTPGDRRPSLMSSRSPHSGSRARSKSDVSRSPCYSVDVAKASCFIRNWYANY
jgi:hypothetical protein